MTMDLLGGLCGDFRRNELHITQRAIAEILGTTQSNISAFERGLNDSALILQWYYEHGFYHYLTNIIKEV